MAGGRPFRAFSVDGGSLDDTALGRQRRETSLTFRVPDPSCFWKGRGFEFISAYRISSGINPVLNPVH